MLLHRALPHPAPKRCSARPRSRQTPGTSSSRAVSCFPCSWPGRLTATRRSTATPSSRRSVPAARLRQLPAGACGRPILAAVTIGLGLKDLLARGAGRCSSRPRSRSPARWSSSCSRSTRRSTRGRAGEDERRAGRAAAPHLHARAVLLLVAATTLVAVALLSVRERIRDSACSRRSAHASADHLHLVTAHAALAAVARSRDPARHRALPRPRPGSPAARPRTPCWRRGGRSP